MELVYSFTLALFLTIALTPLLIKYSAQLGLVLGFLRFNTFPAQLFMGDTGSQFLGFIVCCLAIGITQAQTPAYSVALPLLLPGLGLSLVCHHCLFAGRRYRGRLDREVD